MTDFIGELTIDGLPFDLLPEQALLRPSSAPGAPADELLRAANDTGIARSKELLRPSQEGEKADGGDA
jgi:hypothetical protein